MTASFDYIVVGAGSAGCVLAARLQRRPGDARAAARSRAARSLALDPPADRLRQDDVEPALQLVLLHRPRPEHERAADLLAARQDARRLELDQRPDLHPRPARGLRPLGARSATTAGATTTCCRTSSSPKRNQRGASGFHGGDGPLAVSDIGAQHELIEAFIAGAGEIGVPRTDDFNGARQEGAGYYQLTTWNGLALQHREGLPRPGARGAATCASRPRPRPPRLRARSGAARGRRALPPARRGEDRALPRRGAAGGRRAAVAAAAAALGHRPAARCCDRHGIAVVHDAARRRREPAGPPADPADLRMHASRSPPTTS